MGTVPVITVTGWSNSGKTTFTTRVVEQLSNADVRVGVIKHHGHREGGVDQEGKDSWKYAQAGANPVVLAASAQYAIFVSTPQREATRDELVAKIADDVDFVIVEGFRAEADGAVELYRTAAGHPDPKLSPEERIALITDNDDLAAQVRAEGKPVFGLDDAEAVARYFCDLAGVRNVEL
jgi:molybdopterin-guanine dinucleotide biosynthesis protein MobB